MTPQIDTSRHRATVLGLCSWRRRDRHCPLGKTTTSVGVLCLMLAVTLVSGLSNGQPKNSNNDESNTSTSGKPTNPISFNNKQQSQQQTTNSQEQQTTYETPWASYNTALGGQREFNLMRQSLDAAMNSAFSKTSPAPKIVHTSGSDDDSWSPMLANSNQMQSINLEQNDQMHFVNDNNNQQEQQYYDGIPQTTTTTIAVNTLNQSNNNQQASNESDVPMSEFTFNDGNEDQSANNRQQQKQRNNSRRIINESSPAGKSRSFSEVTTNNQQSIIMRPPSSSVNQSTTNSMSMNINGIIVNSRPRQSKTSSPPLALNGYNNRQTSTSSMPNSNQRFNNAADINSLAPEDFSQQQQQQQQQPNKQQMGLLFGRNQQQQPLLQFTSPVAKVNNMKNNMRQQLPLQPPPPPPQFQSEAPTSTLAHSRSFRPGSSSSVAINQQQQSHEMNSQLHDGFGDDQPLQQVREQQQQANGSKPKNSARMIFISREAMELMQQNLQGLSKRLQQQQQQQQQQQAPKTKQARTKVANQVVNGELSFNSNQQSAASPASVSASFSPENSSNDSSMQQTTNDSLDQQQQQPEVLGPKRQPISSPASGSQVDTINNDDLQQMIPNEMSSLLDSADANSMVRDQQQQPPSTTTMNSNNFLMNTQQATSDGISAMFGGGGGGSGGSSETATQFFREQDRPDSSLPDSQINLSNMQQLDNAPQQNVSNSSSKLNKSDSQQQTTNNNIINQFDSQQQQQQPLTTTTTTTMPTGDLPTTVRGLSSIDGDNFNFNSNSNSQQQATTSSQSLDEAVQVQQQQQQQTTTSMPFIQAVQTNGDSSPFNVGGPTESGGFTSATTNTFGANSGTLTTTGAAVVVATTTPTLTTTTTTTSPPQPTTSLDNFSSNVPATTTTSTATKTAVQQQQQQQKQKQATGIASINDDQYSSFREVPVSSTISPSFSTTFGQQAATPIKQKSSTSSNNNKQQQANKKKTSKGQQAPLNGGGNNYNQSIDQLAKSSRRSPSKTARSKSANGASSGGIVRQSYSPTRTNQNSEWPKSSSPSSSSNSQTANNKQQVVNFKFQTSSQNNNNKSSNATSTNLSNSLNRFNNNKTNKPARNQSPVSVAKIQQLANNNNNNNNGLAASGIKQQRPDTSQPRSNQRGEISKSLANNKVTNSNLKQQATLTETTTTLAPSFTSTLSAATLASEMATFADDGPTTSQNTQIGQDFAVSSTPPVNGLFTAHSTKAHQQKQQQQQLDFSEQPTTMQQDDTPQLSKKRIGSVMTNGQALRSSLLSNMLMRDQENTDSRNNQKSDHSNSMATTPPKSSSSVAAVAKSARDQRKGKASFKSKSATTSSSSRAMPVNKNSNLKSSPMNDATSNNRITESSVDFIKNAVDVVSVDQQINNNNKNSYPQSDNNSINQMDQIDADFMSGISIKQQAPSSTVESANPPGRSNLNRIISTDDITKDMIRPSMRQRLLNDNNNRQLTTASEQQQLAVGPAAEDRQQQQLDGDNINSLRMTVPGEPEQDYPIYSRPPKTTFSCLSQSCQGGYYADLETKCQVFHICQSDGRSDTFLCPNGTIFSQQHFVCVWWWQVDCQQSRQFYRLNDDIYCNGLTSTNGNSNDNQLMNTQLNSNPTGNQLQTVNHQQQPSFAQQTSQINASNGAIVSNHQVRTLNNTEGRVHSTIDNQQQQMINLDNQDLMGINRVVNNIGLLGQQKQQSESDYSFGSPANASQQEQEQISVASRA